MLRVIKAAQRLGFSLGEISELLEARREVGLQGRAREKLVEVEGRIADLEVIAGSLRAALEVGCEDLVECAEMPGCPLPFADVGRDR